MAAVEGRPAGGLPVGCAPPACRLHRLVVTFGADHPGAVSSGARVFHERLGFSPAEAAPAVQSAVSHRRPGLRRLTRDPPTA